MSRDEKVDPVGACVGHRGSRVQAVVNELYDEKIDIVRWNADTATFIGEALSPAKAVKVTLNEEAKSAFVVVPDNQLSLAIGKAGQNVRLAARLTGWRIDIRSEAQVARAALMAVTSSIGDAEAESAGEAGEEAETLTIGGAELRLADGEEAAEELLGAEETGANGHQPTEEGADEAALAADRSHSQEEPMPDVLTAETDETGVK
jgi:transcription antitermination factor NusA-like protein